LVFCVTLIAYLPALSGRFIWNDSEYVTRLELRSLAGLGRIWTDLGATEQYYPLLHSAFWGQHALWGDHPLGYHLVTLLLHAASAILFALVLRRLAVPGAWLAALLFALHPVHVESVAWIAEQKNTLSLVFYLTAALTYLQFDDTRRSRPYFAALVLFILSLLCKTVTATLPAALLVVGWWKRGRLQWRRDVRPLLPWLALGALAGLFSSWVERHYLHAQGEEFALPLLERGLVAGRAVWFYLGNLVWPVDLNFIYPRWTPDAAVWWQWLFPLGLLVLVAALWTLRRRTRAPLAALLFFAGSLFPVLGFVNLYGARYSWVWDHWQYLPDLGPLALAAAGLALGWDRAAIRLHWAGPALAAALAGLLGALTWSHSGMFRDNGTLYRTTIARNPAAWMAHHNLAVDLAKTPENIPEAITHYEAALRINPDIVAPHFNLGLILANIPGRLPEAMAHYEAVLRINPGYAEAHINLGVALADIPGRLPDAITHFEAALRINPENAEVHNNLGIALSNIPGRLPEAIAHYETALRIKPDFPDAHINLGAALAGVPGRLPDAITHFEAALRIKPDSAAAHFSLGVALSGNAERLPEVIAHYEAALRIQPDYPGAHNNLGIALASVPGRLPDAITHYEEALRINPDDPAAHYNLANALMKIPGRWPEAIIHYEEVLRLRPDFEPARRMVNRLRAGEQ
jgi:tetratricopeptide (TPR) repeat protein